MGGNLPAETGRERDQAVGVFRQKLPVDPWPVVKTLQMAKGDQLGQVYLLVFGQQNQVVRFVVNLGLPVVSAPFSHIDLATDHRFDPGGHGGLVEFERAIHYSMVCEGHRPLAGGNRFRDQPFDRSRPVQERILGMDMQMDKISHAITPPPPLSPHYRRTGFHPDVAKGFQHYPLVFIITQAFSGIAKKLYRHP